MGTQGGWTNSASGDYYWTTTNTNVTYVDPCSELHILQPKVQLHILVGKKVSKRNFDIENKLQEEL